jgi:hypothetical protein
LFATDWPLSPADLPTLGIAQPERRKEAKRAEREFPRLAESWGGSGQAVSAENIIRAVDLDFRVHDSIDEDRAWPFPLFYIAFVRILQLVLWVSKIPSKRLTWAFRAGRRELRIGISR